MYVPVDSECDAAGILGFWFCWREMTKTETTLGSSGVIVIVKLLHRTNVSGLCSGLVRQPMGYQWGFIFMPFVNFIAQFCIESSISKACKFSRIKSVLTQNYN